MNYEQIKKDLKKFLLWFLLPVLTVAGITFVAARFFPEYNEIHLSIVLVLHLVAVIMFSNREKLSSGVKVMIGTPVMLCVAGVLLATSTMSGNYEIATMLVIGLFVAFIGSTIQDHKIGETNYSI